MTKSTNKSARKVRLRPHDAFDLIRLLARSQSDPRKAVAELVQNSLDAGARNVELTWFNREGQRALCIWDDGEGIFPEQEREEALRRIAHTIGYSHKRNLSPVQRKEQMVLGQYGIGLIGFWSVGQMLEMKSRVGGGKLWSLRMYEDKASGDVAMSRSRSLSEEATYTQITIFGVHTEVLNKVRPARLQAYLANELRGQLLERQAVVRIVDRVARGRARKQFVVEPRPYLGRPLEAWREFEVPGFESARVELYAVSADEDRTGVVSLACGGTVVLDDIAEIEGAGEARAPWDRGLLEGVIDFPELHVAPGNRRGFTHDEPVAAFLSALEGLESELVEHFESEQQRSAELRQENVARDIRKAFRPVATRLQEYDFFSVRGKLAGASGKQVDAQTGAPSTGEGEELLQPASNVDNPAIRRAPADEDGLLFPPGPLASVEVKPSKLRLPALATRSLRARGLDADGRACSGDVEFSWQLIGPGELQATDDKASFTAPDLELEPDDSPLLRVGARQGEQWVRCEVPITIGSKTASDGRTSGIPDPHPVSAPGESWRSRVVEERWEYNANHRDYLEASVSEARRLRYLVNLFAKEMVLSNFGGPGDAMVLERMVEVLTYLDKGVKRS